MRRPGFTVLELATAAALLMMFVAIAIPTYRAFEGGGENTAARARLAAFEVELARAQADNGGAFPDDLHTQVVAGSEEVVDGATASTGPSMLSVQKLTANNASGTVLSDTGHCIVGVFNVTGDPVWAVDETPAAGACRAGHPTISDESGGWTAGDDNAVSLN